MTRVTFDPTTVSSLAELAELLGAGGVSTTIRVVGGAALVVAYGREATTTDIDALYGLPDEVNCRRRQDRRPPRIALRHPGNVGVWVAPADLLLAMKLLAGRGRRDGTDIDLLCDACRVAPADSPPPSGDDRRPTPQARPLAGHRHGQIIW